MYQAHFGLDRPPFKITPDTSLFFGGSQRGAALEALHYAIKSGEGIVKVVGEVGSGKTMLCRMLELRLSEDAVEVVYIANPSLSPDNILHVIAHELALDVSQEISKVDVMQKIQAVLLQKHANNVHVVLFVEEAQSMPTETLEEIRLLSNLETDQNKLLQMVLFGQPELDEKLALSHIRQLKERITHSFNLAPFPPEDVLQYLNFRLRAVGYRGPDIFSKKTAACVKKYSNGLTRRINILADKSLLAAYSEGSHSVGVAHIKAAAIDSEFAPAKGAIFESIISQFIWAGAGAAAMAIVLYVSMLPEPMLMPSAESFTTDIKKNSVLNEGIEALGIEALDEPIDTKRSDAVKPVVARQSHAAESEQSKSKTLERNLARHEQTKQAVKPVSQAILVSNQSPAVLPRDALKVDGAVKNESKSRQIKTLDKTNSGGKIDERVAVTRQWLSSAEDENYSIQLLMARKSKEAAVEEFLKTLAPSLDVSKVYIYETKLGESTWYSIVYDEFRTRQKAMAALQNLPPSLQASAPYLRRLSTLKRERKEMTNTLTMIY